MAGQRQGLLIMQSARCPGQCRENKGLSKEKKGFQRSLKLGEGVALVALLVVASGQWKL